MSSLANSPLGSTTPFHGGFFKVRISVKVLKVLLQPLLHLHFLQCVSCCGPPTGVGCPRATYVEAYMDLFGLDWIKNKARRGHHQLYASLRLAPP